MAVFHKSLLLGTALLLAAGAAARADDDDALSKLPARLAAQIRPGIAVEQAVAQALAPIRQFDVDGDGLDASDIDTAEASELANQRANAVSRYLRFDLDGNLSVTEAEMRTGLQRQYGRMGMTDNGQQQAQIDTEVQRAFALDKDGDHALSIQEMTVVDPAFDQQQKMVYEPLRQLLLNDPNGDGRVTPAELEGIVRAAFSEVDRSGDGMIDQAEYAAFRGQLQQAAAALRFADCKLPKAGDGEQVSVIGLYYANAQPTVTVTGQDDTTFLARIVVEPGDTPLYVVLTSYLGMVWKFEGQVDRLKHVVVMPVEGRGTDGKKESWAGAGVLGLPKELVTFTKAGACGKAAYDPASPDAQAMKRQVARLTGAPAVNLIGAYSPQGFSIPSGQAIAPQKDHDIVIVGGSAYVMTEGEQPKLLTEGLTLKAQEDQMSKSGGIVEVKPEDVIAPGKVETYQVIPSQDGLRYMVEQGILERTDRGYRLLKPLPRWPAGISGANAVTFLMPKGMPMPAGSLGHSRVIVEP
ncbi:MAG TPA: hypothetical protein VHE77_20510 [Dongiaceae bacterium]|nr:hypothetical protein [Dongiaceae bacterium]